MKIKIENYHHQTRYNQPIGYSVLETHSHTPNLKMSLNVLHLCVNSQTLKCPSNRFLAKKLIPNHIEYVIGLDLKDSELNEKIFKADLFQNIFEQTNLKPNMFDLIINEGGPIEYHPVFLLNVKQLLKTDGKYLSDTRIFPNEENQPFFEKKNKEVKRLFKRFEKTGLKIQEMLLLKINSRTIRKNVFMK